MKIAIHHSTESDSLKAAQELCEQSQSKLSGSPSWALAFCAGKHNQELFYKELKSLLGDIPVLGGAGVGVITNDFFGYNGFETGILLFNEDLSLQAYESASLKNGQQEGGKELAEKLKGKLSDDDTMIMFFDTLISSPPPQIYSGSEIIKGFNSEIGSDAHNIVGSGLVADLGLQSSFVFTGNDVEEHVVSGIVLPKELAMDYKILHGCEPISSYMTITKIEGPVVFEIDNRPALDVILETLGLEKNEDSLQSLTTIVTLGENRGEKFGDFEESKYVNRMIVAGNPENGSVILFEADFEEGTEIQIMSRSNELMIESAGKNSAALTESVNNPMFSFYIDCAGRTAAFSGADEDDAVLIQENFSNIPLFGFYSGVEIAPLMGISRPLDWTGVLLVFSQN